MRAVLIAVVTLLAVPLALVPGQNWAAGEVPPAAQFRPPNGNPGTPGSPAPRAPRWCWSATR